MKRKWIRALTISSLVALPMSLPLVSFCTSCSSYKEVGKIDGTDWSGVYAGSFTDVDYEINDSDLTITYINGISIHANNLAIPNYVKIHETKYKVLLGPKCFKDNPFLYGHVEMNDFINSIPDECFYNSTNIEAIIFHNYPTQIGNLAFYTCQLLLKILVKKGNKLNDDWAREVLSIGEYAFFGCWMEGPISFGPNLQYMGEYSFSQCTKITQINLQFSNNISTIRDGTFSSCTALKTIKLPQSIKQIRKNAFASCKYMEKVELPISGMSMKFGARAFYQCSRLTGFSKPFKLLTAGAGCFSYDTMYDFNTLGDFDSLSKIESNAFASTSLTYLNFTPNQELDIEEYAFSDCQELNILDFSDYEGTNTVPSWSGQHIFFNSNRDKVGTVYMPSKGLFSPEWKQFFIKNDLSVDHGWRFVVKSSQNNECHDSTNTINGGYYE